MLAFLHHCKTDNVGDKYSGPYHYFDFGKYNVIDLRNICSVINYDAAIFGGGAVAGNIRTFSLHHKVKAEKRIGWGFGRTVRLKNPAEYSKPVAYPTGFDFMGIRDYFSPMQERTTFLPCVSCMCPAFDQDYKITRKYAGFFNAKRIVPRLARQDMRPKDVMLNNVSIEAAIAHLASAQVVITNSYHGAYWGMLLGKGVIILHPYSSKFYQFKWKMNYSFAQELKHLHPVSGECYKGVLAECRTLNRQFYAKVLDSLNG